MDTKILKEEAESSSFKESESRSSELMYSMALAHLCEFHLQTAHIILQKMGSATQVFNNRQRINEVIEDSTPKLMAILSNWDEALHRSEVELDFMQKNNIRGIVFGTKEYPLRLSECPDAPLVLYVKGNPNLNSQHIISVVGTRQCTSYGQDIVKHFMEDMHSLLPKALIVSGLAYGIDINAHRQALANNLSTVAVLAHGLDRIYPPMHRQTAKEMLTNGGLITEHMSQTRIDKMNFPKRNRIVAGIADVTVVVETPLKGGALITARIANSYGREVAAFPGNINIITSQGCNNLIKNNGAHLISSADDLMKIMGWNAENSIAKTKEKSTERQLFVDLNAEEKSIIDLLVECNDLHLNIIKVRTNLPAGKVVGLLLQLELKGLVRPLAGGIYHLMS